MSTLPIISLCSSPFTTTTTITLSSNNSAKAHKPNFVSTVRCASSRETLSLTQDHKANQMGFEEIKERFLSFKNHNYLQDLDHFQNLSTGQSPKFMVIACADSRVCPSSVLGFQPGDAFTVRNIANLVPPFQSGPSETNAGLEYAVNSLEVENILVTGHSLCGGIKALMSMQDEVVDSSSFVKNWVIVGKNARSSVKASGAHLSFDQQCRHCEKESVNRSLMNLLTYPWIEDRVSKGNLSIHGGYYDFVNCTFEKWTLNYRGKDEDGYSIKDQEFWS